MFVFLPERTVLFRLASRSLQKVVSNFYLEPNFDSDAFFAIAPPETLISLRSSLRVSLRVCIVVSFSEG